MNFLTLGHITEKLIESILNIVLNFQFDHTCFKRKLSTHVMSVSVTT